MYKSYVYVEQYFGVVSVVQVPGHPTQKAKKKKGPELNYNSRKTDASSRGRDISGGM
jgi:hypothetical protein